MNHWPIILGMTLVTFLPRYGVLALLGRVEMPKPIFRALQYVPPAVLSAIILPGLLLDKDGNLYIAVDNSFLVAGVVAGLVAWRSRNLLLTIVLGMLVLWGYPALLGI